jgi:hypothetical protein
MATIPMTASGLVGSVFVLDGSGSFLDATYRNGLAAAGSFEASAAAYRAGSRTSNKTLAEVLGEDAATLSDPALGSLVFRTVGLELSGYVLLEAGTYNFAVGKGDQVDFTVGGIAVTGSSLATVFTLPEAALVPIELVSVGDVRFTPKVRENGRWESLAIGDRLYASAEDYFGGAAPEATMTGGLLYLALAAFVPGPANAAPVALADSVVLAEDGTVLVNVLANDSDPDGDLLALYGAGGAAHGTVAIEGGRIRYTPDADFNGADAFTYQVSDGRGGIATATVSVSVTPVNDLPRNLAFSGTTIDAAAAAGTVIGQLSATDPDGDPITYSVSDARLAVDAAGRVTIAPGADFSGAGDSLALTVGASDGIGAPVTRAVSLAVIQPEPEPDPAPGPAPAQGLAAAWYRLPAGLTTRLSEVDFARTPDATGTVAALDRTASDVPFWEGGPRDDFAARYTGALNVGTAGSYTFHLTSDDGSALWIDGVRVIDNDGLHGTLERRATIDLAAGAHAIEVRYFERGGYQTLVLEWSGPDTGGARALVSGPALGYDAPEPPPPPNAAPVARDDAATTGEGVAVLIDVRANDTDADGDPLAIAAVGAAQHGTATVENGQIRYTPAAGFAGTDGFTYQVSDGRGGTATASVAVTVEAAPDPDQTHTGEPGLCAEYFRLSTAVSRLSEVDFARTPDATGTVAALDRAASDAPFWDGGPADNFAARYLGDLNVVNGGRYTFHLASDDGSALWIDGVLVLDNDGLHATLERSVTLDLAAGAHAIELRYFERGGVQTLLLDWTGPDTDGARARLSGTSISHGGPVDAGDPGPCPVTGVAICRCGSGTQDPGDGGTGDPANIAPLALDDSVDGTMVDGMLLVPVAAILANDSDPDGDPLTITGLSGAMLHDDDEIMVMAPVVNGEAVFDYTVSDGQGGSDTATVTVRAPAPDPDPGTGDGGTGDGGTGDGGDGGHDHGGGTTDPTDPPMTEAEIEAFVAAERAKPEAHAHGDDAGKAREHMALLELVPRSEATHIAIRDGDWFDPATWYQGRIPGADARVLIPESVSVSYDGVSDVSLFTVRVDGELAFATDANTRMVVDTLVVAPTGRLEIGTAANPVAAGVEAEILIANNGNIDTSWDPTLVSRGVISHGEVEIHGAEKTAFLKVATAPMRGATTITLEEAPEGWRVGDTIVLTGTHKTGWTWDNAVRRVVHRESQDEEVTITAIDGNRVTIDRALQHDHDTPRADLKAYVANMTRNVTIASEDGEATAVHHRGHTMFMHSDDVDVRYAAFDDLGRTDKSEAAFDVGTLGSVEADSNIKGRYSLHLHKTGTEDRADPAFVVGSAVSGSPGWGFVQHSSHAVFVDNAAFDVFGAHFAAEDGDETGVWARNIAIRGEGIGYGAAAAKQEGDLPRHDNGRTGDGFFFAGRLVESAENVAANTTHGFVWMHRSAPASPLVANMDRPEVGYGATRISPDHAPIQGFRDNEAFGTQVGLIVVKANHRQEHDARTVLDGFVNWETSDGVDISYTSHYTIPRLRPDRDHQPRADRRGQHRLLRRRQHLRPRGQRDRPRRLPPGHPRRERLHPPGDERRCAQLLHRRRDDRGRHAIRQLPVRAAGGAELRRAHPGPARLRHARRHHDLAGRDAVLQRHQDRLARQPRPPVHQHGRHPAGGLHPEHPADAARGRLLHHLGRAAGDAGRGRRGRPRHRRDPEIRPCGHARDVGQPARELRRAEPRPDHPRRAGARPARRRRLHHRGPGRHHRCPRQRQRPRRRHRSASAASPSRSSAEPSPSRTTRSCTSPASASRERTPSPTGRRTRRATSRRRPSPWRWSRTRSEAAPGGRERGSGGAAQRAGAIRQSQPSSASVRNQTAPSGPSRTSRTRPTPPGRTAPRGPSGRPRAAGAKARRGARRRGCAPPSPARAGPRGSPCRRARSRGPSGAPAARAPAHGFPDAARRRSRCRRRCAASRSSSPPPGG